MLIIIKNSQDYNNKNNDNNMYTIRSKKRICDCAQEYTHVDFSQPSAIDMEAQVNVSYQVRALLPDLVNKPTNTNTCNKPLPLRGECSNKLQGSGYFWK